MTDLTKPISSSNPPESKGTGRKFPETQHSVTGENRVVMAENDDNFVAIVNSPEPAPKTSTRSKNNTTTKSYTTKK